MVRLRKAISYRRIERPYTRVSKYREKSFIKANPMKKIVRYVMGSPGKKFPYILELVAKSDLQIRDNSFESARQSSNRLLEKLVGTSNYTLRLRLYPHHILRENPLAAGAGADRFSTGMKHSFGKPIGAAAQIRKGQVVFEIHTRKQYIDNARLAMKRIVNKLPSSFTVVVRENK